MTKKSKAEHEDPLAFPPIDLGEIDLDFGPIDLGEIDLDFKADELDLENLAAF